LAKNGQATLIQSLFQQINILTAEIINNELTQYEFDVVHAALQQDLFRYDASEVMARPIGSNLLWKFFVNFIREGSESIVKLLNELDREI
jgi:hypothetical protein